MENRRMDCGFALLVVLLCMSLSCDRQSGSSPDQSVSFIELNDFSQWRGAPGYWTFAEGVITGETTEQNVKNGPTYLIWQGGELDDFELHFKFRFDGESGNSGVQFRSTAGEDFMVTGYQADIEVGHDWTGVLVEMGGRLHLARRGQKVVVAPDGTLDVIASVGDPEQLQSYIQPNEWNEFVVTAIGNHIVHKINGHVMIDVVDGQVDHAAKNGILALQLNRANPMRVQFKDIRVKRLGEKSI
jgi:hypothetical protein